MPKLIKKKFLEIGLAKKNFKSSTQKIKEIKIYDKTFFYPIKYKQTFNKNLIKQNTITIHWWEGSWKNIYNQEKYKNLNKILSFISHQLLERNYYLYTKIKKAQFLKKYKKLI